MFANLSNSKEHCLKITLCFDGMWMDLNLPTGRFSFWTTKGRSATSFHFGTLNTTRLAPLPQGPPFLPFCFLFLFVRKPLPEGLKGLEGMGGRESAGKKVRKPLPEGLKGVEGMEGKENEEMKAFGKPKPKAPQLIT